MQLLVERVAVRKNGLEAPGIFMIWDGMGIVAKRIEHILSSDPPKLRITSVPDCEACEREAEEVSANRSGCMVCQAALT